MTAWKRLVLIVARRCTFTFHHFRRWRWLGGRQHDQTQVDPNHRNDLPPESQPPPPEVPNRLNQGNNNCINECGLALGPGRVTTAVRSVRMLELKSSMKGIVCWYFSWPARLLGSRKPRPSELGLTCFGCGPDHVIGPKQQS